MSLEVIFDSCCTTAKFWGEVLTGGMSLELLSSAVITITETDSFASQQICSLLESL